MKFRSFLAFLFTLTALIMVASGIVWYIFYYLVVKPFCLPFAVSIIPETDYVEIGASKGKLINILIKNVGAVKDEYSIRAKGPEWIVVKPEKLTLEPGEASNVYLYVSPSFGVSGEHEIVVSAVSNCVSESKIIKAEILK
jgi:uncharacterized membrane protein